MHLLNIHFLYTKWSVLVCSSCQEHYLLFIKSLHLSYNFLDFADKPVVNATVQWVSNFFRLGYREVDLVTELVPHPEEREYKCLWPDTALCDII